MLFNVDTMSVSDVETTLNQRCTPSIQPFFTFHFSMLSQRRYDIISMLFQCGLNVSGSYIETNLASEKYRFAERFISFIKIIFIF